MCGEFVGEPFRVEIRDGIAHLSWPDGSHRHLPLRVFRMDYSCAGKAIAEYDAAFPSNIVRFKRKKR